MMKYCPMCGTKFMPNAKFCLECGLSIAEYNKKLKRIISDRVKSKMTSVPKTESAPPPTVNADTDETVERLSRAANANDVEAMFTLGQMYYTGDKVAQNYQRAREWWLKAAEHGNDKAMFNLGVMYYYGFGTTRDLKKAIDWYKQAAAAGNADAPSVLDKIYAKELKPTVNEPAKPKTVTPEQKREGERLFKLGRKMCREKKYGVAIEHLKQAVDLGNAKAMELLGDVYSDGIDETEYCDYRRAMACYVNAVNAGSVVAMLRIGYLYGSTEEFGKDQKTAEAWRKKAVDTFIERAAHGDTKAMIWLAHMYKNGTLVSRSVSKYNELISKAAHLGDGEAMGILANDFCLEKDYAEGTKWVLKAAKAGDVLSMMSVAHEYETDIHMYNFPQDYEEAIKWYQKVIDALIDEESDKFIRDMQKHIDECREKIRERDRTARNASENNEGTSPLKVLTDILTLQFPIRDVYYVAQNDKADRKVCAAVQAYGGLLDGNDIVLGCYDATVFGAADEGCIFTMKGICILTTSVDNHVRFVDYEDINNISLRGIFMKDVYVNDFKIDTAGIGEEESIKFCDMLKALRTLILELRQKVRQKMR